MHNGIVNGYQLLCVTHIVLGQHRGIAAFYTNNKLDSFVNHVFNLNHDLNPIAM